MLQTLWQHQPISRRDLAARIHLTPATVTNIVTEFITAGIVHEIGPGAAGRGRRPTLLALEPGRAYLVGCNISRSELSIGLFTLALQPAYTVTYPITVRTAPTVGETLVDLIDQAIADSGVEHARVIAIGLSSPGPLSVAEGVIFCPPGFAEWSNLALGQIVHEAFGLPVWLENDANANALAEHWLGAGRRYENFVYVESHSGVGSGLVIEGRLFAGSGGVGAEIGHTSIDRNGPRCPCGNYGCVELYSSGPAIVAAVQRAIDAGEATCCESDAQTPLTYEAIITAALAGDALAIDVIEQAASALAIGLVNAINLLDPEAVIVGYQLNRTGELCLRPIRSIIRERAIPQATETLDVVAGELTERVGITGAACCALAGLFQQPDILLFAPPLPAD